MDAMPILVPEADLSTEDAHTIGRKGARMPQVEVITRGERRRVWTLEQKREIVAESLGSELTLTEVARKHGISSGLRMRCCLSRRARVVSRSRAAFAGVGAIIHSSRIHTAVISSLSSSNC